MARSPFGWSYPPGAENDPNAPWNQPDYPECDVCGEFEDECTCDDPVFLGDEDEEEE